MMPIYEYECASCHHQFDMMQKISDPPAKQCPRCFESTVVRLVSAAGFQLKGTGWYATDFKDKGKPEAKKSETSSADTKNTETKSSEPSKEAKPSSKVDKE